MGGSQDLAQGDALLLVSDRKYDTVLYIQALGVLVQLSRRDVEDLIPDLQGRPESRVACHKSRTARVNTYVPRADIGIVVDDADIIDRHPKDLRDNLRDYGLRTLSYLG